MWLLIKIGSYCGVYEWGRGDIKNVVYICVSCYRVHMDINTRVLRREGGVYVYSEFCNVPLSVLLFYKNLFVNCDYCGRANAARCRRGSVCTKGVTTMGMLRRN